MILEGLVTTRTANGQPHLTPMGPLFGTDPDSFLLRPFSTSSTYQNLSIHPQGVLHVTDDALLMAYAALGEVPIPPWKPASSVEGFVLLDACRVMEFIAEEFDRSNERVSIRCRIVHRESLRDFWGFNRAKHAVLEAAILCSRLHLIPLVEVREEFRRLGAIVEKTSGPREFEAFIFLSVYLEQYEEAKK